MSITKEELRDKLFNKYYEVQDGVEIGELVDKLSFISNVWKQLHNLCQENIKHFDRFSYLVKIIVIEKNQKHYLILNWRLSRYVVIDIDKMENITKEEFRSEFDEDFLALNFDEPKSENGINFTVLEKYEGSLQELLDFYFTNKEVLDLPNEIYYKIYIEDAYTYLYINFIGEGNQLGFRTPDQFLYDHIYLRDDLSAAGMQDSVNKMGSAKFSEIVSKLREIKIPINVIPNDLYQQFKSQIDEKKFNINVKTSE